MVIGDLVVIITESEDGGYIVTCPFDPELVTQGETIDEAIAMAKDARNTLAEARAKPAKPSIGKPARRTCGKRALKTSSRRS